MHRGRTTRRNAFPNATSTQRLHASPGDSTRSRCKTTEFVTDQKVHLICIRPRHASRQEQGSGSTEPLLIRRTTVIFATQLSEATSTMSPCGPVAMIFECPRFGRDRVKRKSCATNRAERTGSARLDHRSTCSAMARASSTSMPRYRTVLSILVWPSKSCTARRLPVRR